MEKLHDIPQDPEALCGLLMGGIESSSDSDEVHAEITWAHYPYRYILTRYDQATVERRRFRARTSVSVRGYVLSRMSAKRIDTGLHEFSRYVILPQTGLQAAFHHELPHPDELTEEDKEQHRIAIEFGIDHHLGVPTTADDLEVTAALKYAALDGCELLT